MNRSENSLSVEQEFNHRVFAGQVAQLTREEAQELLVQMYQQMILKENLYKELFLSQEKDLVDSWFGTKKN